MKRAVLLTSVLFLVVFFTSNSFAQTTPAGNGKGPGAKINWVDADGDGICDNVGTSNQGVNRAGKGYGKKDGTGSGTRPQDGTGYGKKGGNATASGTHDGTGPKGKMNRGGRK
jgi:hypothetical protein